MIDGSVFLKVDLDGCRFDIPGVRVAFSAHQCFSFDGGEEDLRCLEALGKLLENLSGLALYGDGPLLEYLLEHAPHLRNNVSCLISDAGSASGVKLGIKCVGPQYLPAEIASVFLCETLAFPLMQMKKRLPKSVNVIEPSVLWRQAPEAIPDRAWVSLEPNIYPIDIPEISFKKGMDLLLVDCPSRNLSMMPNGLGYVHNALKKTSINFQTLDLDIIVYHRYHIHRMFDMGGRIILPNGDEAPTDPWLAENYDFWAMNSEFESASKTPCAVLEFFNPLIEEIVEAVVNAKPKMLGLSIQQCNEAFSREVVNRVKSLLPDVLVIVGGYSCYNPDIGRRAFPECDYMFIGEAELTIAPIIEAIAKGEKPFNQPGVLSRFDTPDYKYVPGPVPHNIDQIEFPKYEWFGDLGIYRNYNGYQLTPIIASRGCRWSRCTFCAERFYWRIRSARNFVEELRWLVDQGCYLFMFNESDLNGMPEKMLEICDEVILEGLHKRAKLTGQLRIHKKSTRTFFDKLKAANFVALRFGVDAFSDNALRLQKKGYTVETVSQNLRDCWEAGIYTEVNWVIGVPGETEQDIEEGVELMLENQKYIGRLANINPLILVNGSVYWIDPDRFNIVFRGPKEKLFEQFPRALPADRWYSTEPYIDAQVRKERFEKIVLSLHDAGFPVGNWAARVIEDVKLARDKMRSVGGGEVMATPRLGADGVDGNAQEEARNVAASSQIPADPAVASPEGEPAASKGEPALRLRETATHVIIRGSDGYYAIPRALGDVDLTSCNLSSLDGAIHAADEGDLMARLEESANWANSRGHYNPQRTRRERGDNRRNRVFCGEMASKPLEFKPFVIEFDGQCYALREEDWRSLRQGEVPAAAQFWNGGQTDGSPLIPGESFARKLVRRMPIQLQIEVRRAASKMESALGSAENPLSGFSDRKLLKLLLATGWRKFALERRQNGERQGKNLGIACVVSRGATPELLWTLGNFNVVKFDNVYYALPLGQPIDWRSGVVASLPGVITSKSLKSLTEQLEKLLGRKETESVVDRNAQPQVAKGSGPADAYYKAPMLLGSVENHNIVSYEGWIYGIPQTLGEIDLTETDIMEIPGVIRDVSRDVVEHEIIDSMIHAQ